MQHTHFKSDTNCPMYITALLYSMVQLLHVRNNKSTSPFPILCIKIVAEKQFLNVVFLQYIQYNKKKLILLKYYYYFAIADFVPTPGGQGLQKKLTQVTTSLSGKTIYFANV